jgi:beta-glucanase (GH16 family)
MPEPEKEMGIRQRIISGVTVGLLGAGIIAACSGGGDVERPPTSSQTAETACTSLPDIEAEPGLELTWEADFSRLPDGAPDSSMWRVATPEDPIYNDEEQKYTTDPENVRIEGGCLVLEAHKTDDGYTSGKVELLHTDPSRENWYIEPGSRLEARLRLPSGSGTWPAFWLLSANQPYTSRLNPTDADWEQERFYMWDGEVDIMEFYGSTGEVEATVHTFANGSPEASPRPEVLQNISDGEFHTYTLDYDEDALIFSVDGEEFFRYTKNSSQPELWPFTRENKLYPILNLAMGGTGIGEIDDSQAETGAWRLEIESVSYYQR